MRVLERYFVNHLGGWAIVLNERGRQGDTIRCGDRTWVVRGIETFAILRPPLPWSFHLTGEGAPEVGDEVVFEGRRRAWGEGSCPHCGSISVVSLDCYPAYYSCTACGETSVSSRPATSSPE